ncbi:S8 family serine peptidase [Glaciecola sp. SC05]|uniref:S8 family peptidase n=1 Tax=Glaciecola sp. SC05 TaxID=1987355 RepID=UPI003527D59B
MSIEKLKDQIKDRGAANAIVCINPVTMMPYDTSNSTLVGKVSRIAPMIDRKLVSELSGLFNFGWNELRASGAIDTKQLSKYTPLLRRLLDAKQKTPSQNMVYFPLLGIAYGAVNQLVLEKLETNRAVDDIQSVSDSLGLIQPVPDEDTDDGQQDKEVAWGVERMGAPQLWKQGLTGKDILVAHMDTGVDTTHPALSDVVISNRMVSIDGQDVSEQAVYSDSSSHGTHTAATIAGRNVAGQPLVGMAPGASLASATVINGGDTFARLLAGLEFALAANARILSISLGISPFDDSLVGIMNTLRTQQLLPIVAIGNDPMSSASPGNYTNVLSVGATDKGDRVAPFSGSAKMSGFGAGPTLCAPGKNILSAVPGGGYKTLNGSSMAVPHVAGLAAMLLEAEPYATSDQIQQAIVESCSNPANISSDRIGAGIPNALKALERLREIYSRR